MEVGIVQNLNVALARIILTVLHNPSAFSTDQRTDPSLLI